MKQIIRPFLSSAFIVGGIAIGVAVGIVIEATGVIAGKATGK